MAGVGSVGALLREQADRFADRCFVDCEGERRTYAQIADASERVAAGLLALGLSPGDRVAVLAPNRIEGVELFLGAAVAGVVQVPLNVFLKGEFLRHQLADSDATVVVADADGLAAVAPLVEDLPNLTHVVPLDAVDADLPVPTVPWADLVSSGLGGQRASLPATDAATLHSIVYTSGTTGLPKGCMLSHGYHTHAGAASGTMVGYRAGDVVLTALPLYHGWARGTLMGTLCHGMTAVLDGGFSATGLLDRLIDTQATVFAGVGAMGQALLATPPDPARDRAHRLRTAFMIPFDPEPQRRFEERFGCQVLSQMYGQTECGAIAYGNVGALGGPGALGAPSPHLEVMLVDADDREVPAGEVGEIVVRPRVAHSLAQGYWRRPAATVTAWRNLWHHTGDLARRDHEGHLTFVDRAKDALRRRGENISSVELERALTGHDDIAEAAVHAVPSPLGEDDIKACLVLADGAALTPDGLFAYCRDTLPYYAIPRYVELVDALPRNATMRVMKHRLRERGVTPQTWDLEALGLVVAPHERRRAAAPSAGGTTS